MLKYVFLCALVLSAVELAQGDCNGAIVTCGHTYTQSILSDKSVENICKAISTFTDCVKTPCADDPSTAANHIKSLSSIKCGSTMVCSSLMLLVLMAMAARLFTRA